MPKQTVDSKSIRDVTNEIANRICEDVKNTQGSIGWTRLGLVALTLAGCELIQSLSTFTMAKARKEV